VLLGTQHADSGHVRKDPNLVLGSYCSMWPKTMLCSLRTWPL
jgi:hypothetical protein